MLIKSADYVKYTICIIITTTVGKKNPFSIHFYTPFLVHGGVGGIGPFGEEDKVSSQTRAVLPHMNWLQSFASGLIEKSTNAPGARSQISFQWEFSQHFWKICGWGSEVVWYSLNSKALVKSSQGFWGHNGLRGGKCCYRRREWQIFFLFLFFF